VKDNSIRVNLLAGVESALNHGGLGAAVAEIISVGVAAVAGAGHDCILTFARPVHSELGRVHARAQSH
jgi:hypothetical protein